MTSAAIGAIALSNSALALRQSHEADLRSCEVFIGSYRADTATVEKMREYSQCVDMVHPSASSPEEILVFKGMLLLAFIGMGIGMRAAAKDSYAGGLMGYFVFGMLGFIALPAVVLTGVALIVGVLWLLGVI